MNIWERTPKKGRRRAETAKEFAAFTQYLLLGSDRSVRKALEQNGNTKNRSLWEGYCSAWRWVERAAAYDASVEAESRKEYEKRRRELARKRALAEFTAQEVLDANAGELKKYFVKLLAQPTVDIEQIDAKGTISRVKGLQPSQVVTIHKELRETLTKMVTGLRQTDVRHQNAQPQGAGGVFRIEKTIKKTRVPKEKKTDGLAGR